MQDERKTPQDADADEVEAHLARNASPEEPSRSALNEDDEVEAHLARNASPEYARNKPSE